MPIPVDSGENDGNPGEKHLFQTEILYNTIADICNEKFKKSGIFCLKINTVCN